MDVLQGLIDPPDPGSGKEPIFENLPVHPEDLPGLNVTDFHPLATAWLRWKNKRNLILFIVSMIAVLVGIYFVGWTLWIIPACCIPIGIFVFAQTSIRKAYAARKYALRERDITFRKGWIWWSETAVPFNRIQHCEIEQGPIEKMYGLATLEVYTAGKSSSDVSIGGLEREKAERLKDFILGRIQKESDEEE